MYVLWAFCLFSAACTERGAKLTSETNGAQLWAQLLWTKLSALATCMCAAGKAVGIPGDL